MNEPKGRSKKKSKDTLKQMKMRTHNPTFVGHWESNPKTEIHNIKSYLQKTKTNKKRKKKHPKTRKSSNKQSDFILKGT